ncbi:MRG domain-containing protein [Absidia repens]|uniref:MRG domain-containing protein n=1 Tax=Absidia repens TaxID=90262 RepID=A0A1X2IN94_9FUNG|nr:MRG domain-containing protein [Absidia repens]
MQHKRKSSKAQLETSDTRGRKRQRDSSTEKEDDSAIEHDLWIDIPQPLKDILVEDSEKITKGNRLVHLPAKMTVATILDRYLQNNDTDGKDETLEQIIQGLKLYFYHTLGKALLYRSERRQYEDLIATGKNSIDIYGGEHLLRLFVELPMMMTQAKVDTDTLDIMKSTFMDILIFLQDNGKEFFVKDYRANRDR